jgi:hypothetical protein
MRSSQASSAEAEVIPLLTEAEKKYPPLWLSWSIWGIAALFYLAGFYHRVSPAVMTRCKSLQESWLIHGERENFLSMDPSRRPQELSSSARQMISLWHVLEGQLLVELLQSDG